MKRHARSLVAALAILAVTAGFAAAHAMPSASDSGIGTAQDKSGLSVPMLNGVDGSRVDQDATDTNTEDTLSEPAPPSDTHGAAVSAAATGPTPSDGGWANHGAYVSSIATGWGTQTADANRTGAPSTPTQAATGLSHRP